ncbi:MAG TPA: hypothetical protein VFN64_09550 [Burkholderiaceae bacterium]|nr:hypothetical protein [Burkholderiaceae bacterium]
MPRIDRRAALLSLLVAVAAPLAQASDVPPTDGAALLKWLQSGGYKEWAKESAPHRSMGPHQTLVLTYLNAPLDKSLGAKAKQNPRGSAAVKELLDAAGKLSGWAVAVKTATESEGGKGWFWYEILGTTPGSNVVANGHGVALCVGCHARGRDGVLTEHPLD